MKKIDTAFFGSKIPKRKADSHKGDFGTALIFAGSCGMAGAAVLCGRAALRSGAGLVRFLLPSFEDPIYPILQTCVPEATCTTEYSDLSSYTAIAAGSGLGKDPQRIRILNDIIASYSGVLILDADALNLIASGEVSSDALAASKAVRIITPHIGEAKRLLGSDKKIKTEKERLDAALCLCKKYDSIVVLKGNNTLVASPDGNVFMNTTGNPGMATGGSGDVLSGIIASFVAQKLPAVDAACCGVFIHGLSGDIARDHLGENCVIAGDIIDYLPSAFRSV